MPRRKTARFPERVTVRLDQAAAQIADREARRRGLTVSSLVRRLLLAIDDKELIP